MTKHETKDGGRMIFFDGNFSIGSECDHHCLPTCHPGQTGPKWQYGCLYPFWPENKNGDFCPFVKCGGKLENCEVPKGPTP